MMMCPAEYLALVSGSLYVRERRLAEVKHTISEVWVSPWWDKNRMESGIKRCGLGKKDGWRLLISGKT